MNHFDEWVVCPPETTQERRRRRRREKAEKWRQDHFRMPVAWRLWHMKGCEDVYSRKVHLAHGRGQSSSWCGSYELFVMYPGGPWGGTEYDSFVAEEPEVPTSDSLCKHCRAAVRRDGTHPFRRRE